MAVGIVAHKGLEHRRGHLEYQRYDADLGEVKSEFVFQQRVQGRYYRLYHVVEQVARAHGEEYRVGRAFRHVRMPFQLVE